MNRPNQDKLDKQRPIEEDMKTFIQIWAAETWKVRDHYHDKVRGLRIWSHDIQRQVEDAGYSWKNAAGDPLKGGKLTRFLTRVKNAFRLNLIQYEGWSDEEAWLFVNGAGTPEDWIEGKEGTSRPYFQIIEEAPVLVEDKIEWDTWFGHLKPATPPRFSPQLKDKKAKE